MKRHKRTSLLKNENLSKKDIKRVISPQEELFCKLYAWEQWEEYRGNGSKSFAMAFDCDNKDVIRNGAYRLLQNAHICKYIDSLIDKAWFTDQNMDSQLCFLATQHADLSAKLWAIREYNKLKQRIIEKIDKNTTITFNINAINEALEKELNQ